MGVVVWRSNPISLLGLRFSAVFCLLAPATLFGVAFALSSCGVRFSRWAVLTFLALVALTAAAGYWLWQRWLWAV